MCVVCVAKKIHRQTEETRRTDRQRQGRQTDTMQNDCVSFSSLFSFLFSLFSFLFSLFSLLFSVCKLRAHDATCYMRHACVGAGVNNSDGDFDGNNNGIGGASTPSLTAQRAGRTVSLTRPRDAASRVPADMWIWLGVVVVFVLVFVLMFVFDSWIPVAGTLAPALAPPTPPPAEGAAVASPADLEAGFPPLPPLEGSRSLACRKVE